MDPGQGSRSHRRLGSGHEPIQNTYAPGAYDELINADMDTSWSPDGVMATDYGVYPGQGTYPGMPVMPYHAPHAQAGFAMAPQMGRSESPSTAMVRRNQQQQLARAKAGQLRDYDGMQAGASDLPAVETEEEALARARKVKAEAQAQRKSLVPFVQKLLSFLDTAQWNHLIHWTKDGKAFVITDDEAFAKEVIPRMFKHNNYPSFVRQLNMYGFHKRVGLDEGSFHANEQGVRMPHTYEHKYFQRDKPELAWLIAKPPPKSAVNSKQPGKRKRAAVGVDADGSSEDLDDTSGKDDKITIPRSELVGMRKDLSEYRQTSQTMSMVIAELRENKNLNKALSQRVLHLEEQNRKQAQVLNSIMQFLQLYAKKDGGQSITQTQSYGPLSPRPHNAAMQRHQVVNLDDVGIDALVRQHPAPRGRRPFALLPAPEASTDYAFPTQATAGPGSSTTQSHHMDGLFDGGIGNLARAPSPTSPQTILDANTPSALPASPQTIDGSTRVPSVTPNPPPGPSAVPAPATTQAAHAASGAASQTSSGPTPHAGAASAASPTTLPIRAPSPLFELGSLPPNEQFSQLTSHLENQDERVRSLLSRVGSYSPGGRLRGLHGWEGDGTSPTDTTGMNPGDDDMSRWLVDGHTGDEADYFGGAIADSKGLDMDFSLPVLDADDGAEMFSGLDKGQVGKVVGSVGSSANSPAAAGEEDTA